MSRGCRPGRGDTGAPGSAARDNGGEADDRGMVTAELAVALPVLVLAGVLAVTGVQVASAQLRCLDAAGIAARLAARGERAVIVTSAATSAAPRDAQVSVSRRGDLVTAVVTADVHPLGLAGLLPGFTVKAEAADPVEPESIGPSATYPAPGGPP